MARGHCAVGSLAIFAHVAFPRCCDGLPHGEPDVAGLAEGRALRALDLVPATSGAGFFPPPDTPEGPRPALHREAKKPSPAALHCVPARWVRVDRLRPHDRHRVAMGAARNQGNETMANIGTFTSNGNGLGCVHGSVL